VSKMMKTCESPFLKFYVFLLFILFNIFFGSYIKIVEFFSVNFFKLY